MATTNPFDLLGDNDNDDPTLLIASLPPAAQAAKKPANPTSTKPQPKLPSKPLPPAQAVQEGRFERGAGRGNGRGNGGRGNGRGRGGVNRDNLNNENVNGGNGGYSNGDVVDVDKPERGVGINGGRLSGYRGGRRGGYATANGGYENFDGDRPRRVFERRSGTGRGNELKRDGSGRGNWGSPTDEVPVETEEPVVEAEKNGEPEKPAGQEDAVDATKEIPSVETEEKEPEVKEMTLEEYEKVLEEKRQALQPHKSEERKVVLDKDLAKMQLLSSKKSEEEIFAKLGSEKDKRKEAADKEEKAKKSLSISEFLKPAEGERYHNPGGRGRGRGRGARGGYGSGGNRMSNMPAPAIEDVAQFPLLGVK